MGLLRRLFKNTHQASNYFKLTEEYGEFNDFTYSPGFAVDKDGHLANLIWDSPAFNAHLINGMTLLAVNGMNYKAAGLKAAIAAAKNSKEPIELLFKNNERYQTVRLDYHDGLKYPHLVRIDGTKDRLSAILEPIK